MKRQHEPWRDEMDIARITADRRNIVTGWIVVFVMIALGTVAPAIVPLMAGGSTEAQQSATQTAPETPTVAQCGHRLS
jgi:hypothetical protein